MGGGAPFNFATMKSSKFTKTVSLSKTFPLIFIENNLPKSGHISILTGMDCKKQLPEGFKTESDEEKKLTDSDLYDIGWIFRSCTGEVV